MRKSGPYLELREARKVWHDGDPTFLKTDILETSKVQIECISNVRRTQDKQSISYLTILIVHRQIEVVSWLGNLPIELILLVLQHTFLLRRLVD